MAELFGSSAAFDEIAVFHGLLVANGLLSDAPFDGFSDLNTSTAVDATIIATSEQMSATRHVMWMLRCLAMG
jgi:hypothetical protein